MLPFPTRRVAGFPGEEAALLSGTSPICKWRVDAGKLPAQGLQSKTALEIRQRRKAAVRNAIENEVKRLSRPLNSPEEKQMMGAA